jgi:hypothetical protein
VVATDRVLHRPHQREARQEHGDPGGHDQRRIGPLRQHPHGEEHGGRARRQEPADDLAEERRQPVARQQPPRRVDDRRDQERHPHRDPGRAQQQRQRARQPGRAGHRHPARVRVGGAHGVVERDGRLVQAERAALDGLDEPVHRGQQGRSSPRWVTSRIDVIGAAVMPRWQQIVTAVKVMSTSTDGSPNAFATRSIASVVSPDPSPLLSSTPRCACTGR